MREIKQKMRKAGVLLFAACVASPLWAQMTEKVSLNLKNASLIQALQELRQQAKVRFVYSDKELQTARPVSASIEELSFQAALDVILRNQPYTYEIGTNGVYIIKPLKSTVVSEDTQMRTVSGKVVDINTGIPLIGASVQNPKGKQPRPTALLPSRFRLHARHWKSHSWDTSLVMPPFMKTRPS